QSPVEEPHIVGRLELVGHPAPRENIRNLPDRENTASRVLGAIEQSRLGRRDREVAPVGGALETGRILAHEGARDHTTYSKAFSVLKNGLTKLIEPFKAEILLVRGDLEHRIRRGVEDRLAG